MELKTKSTDIENQAHSNEEKNSTTNEKFNQLTKTRLQNYRLYNQERRQERRHFKKQTKEMNLSFTKCHWFSRRS